MFIMDLCPFSERVGGGNNSGNNSEVRQQRIT